MFYVVMNVAALLSGPLVDVCTIVYKNKEEEEEIDEGQEGVVPEWTLSGYR